MDDRLRIFIWILGSGGSLALLGAAFGAIVGYIHVSNGGGAGTTFGLTVARAVENAAGKELSSTRKGAIIGAADGFLFLGVLGVLFGAFQGYRGTPPGEFMDLAAVLGGLMVGAVADGLMAYALVRVGARAVAGLCAGALVVGLPAAFLGGPHGLIVGLVLGGVVGALLSLWSTSARPHFTPPPRDEPRRPSSTDVTSGPPTGFTPRP